MKKFLIVLCVLLTLLTFLSFAQNKNLPQELNEAIELIDSKEYSSALVRFQTLRDKFPQRKSLIDFFIIKCYDELSQYENVERYSREFISSYPQSNYVNQVKIFLIKSLTEQNKFEEAFENSIDLLKNTNSISQRIELKNYIEQSIAKNLTSNFLKNYSDRESDRTILPFALYLTAKSYYQEGDTKSGERYTDIILNNYITSEEYLLAVNLKSQVEQESTAETDILVGVMFPLTNENPERTTIVEKILEGVQYAFHEYNKDRENKIGLIIEDTKNDPNEIVRIMKEFDADKRIKCVIGPIFSTECSDVIKNINLTDLSFISPTATDEDLTEKNEQFFQANPPFDLRGKALAQFAFFVESKSRFAVINSIEGYSTILANAFVDEFKRLGGQIELKETFKDLRMDIESIFSRLKSVLSQIDGIYLPISQSREAEILISELEKLNLNVPVYGTQDWLEAKGLQSSISISNKIRITSDFFIDYQDEKFNEFSKQFAEVLNREPVRFCLYGYDAAKHIINALRGTTTSRYGLRLKLSNGFKTVGYKNNIAFGSKRRNTYINILRYSEGKFSLVERFKATE